MAGQQQPVAVARNLLGIAFNADGLDLEQAEERAWQMWMERLDPQELRGSAFYDGPVLLPNGKRALIIAISGPRAAVAYVRDAFAAPNLAAYPGMLPVPLRLIDSNDLPRERLELVAYIDAQGALLATTEDTLLHNLAQHAHWPVSQTTPQALPRVPQRLAQTEVSGDATRAMQALRLDGATEVQLRIWKPSYRSRQHPRQRLLFALLGTMLILVSAGIIAARFLPQTSLAKGLPISPTATMTATAVSAFAPANVAAPIMVVAPLTLKISCVPGKYSQFIISNNGTLALSWTSNGMLFAPRLTISAINGQIPPGASQVIQVTLGQSIKTGELITLVIQSNGGTARIGLTLSNC